MRNAALPSLWKPGLSTWKLTTNPIFSAESLRRAASRRSVKEEDGSGVKGDGVVSPFMFTEVACRLILV